MGELAQCTSAATARPPFWNLNIPEEQWTDDCPVYLAGLDKKAMDVLMLTDDEFRARNFVMDWEAARETVSTGRIDRFKRLPSIHRGYRAFRYQLGAYPGGVMQYILDERLRWPQPVIAQGKVPFEVADDYKILYNDWPYEVEDDIVHLVVWVKFPLDEDPATTLLTEKSRQAVDGFVARTFRSRVPADNVVWWRNTVVLRSVPALEHFHVMLYRPDPDFLREVTGGDIPLFVRADAQSKIASRNGR